MKARHLRIVALAFVLLLAGRGTARASRIEDLCDVQGIRANQLVGYGLVVGLRGTGDTGQARFTVQSVAAMLRRLGTQIDPAAIQSTNTAAVMVTATLPPFVGPGTRIDVVVSSLGNARSLEGGTLVQAALAGADRQVYAAAQGPLVTGGFSATGSTGTSYRQNHTTVGRIPQGAIVERRVESQVVNAGTIDLSLKAPSVVTAQRIAEALVGRFGEGSAAVVDPATVRLTVPADRSEQPLAFLAEVQLVEVEADAPARVVVDERTGTVVIGEGVRIREVAIAQGSLTVQIDERLTASQPNPFAGGTTQTLPSSAASAQADQGPLHHSTATATLADVVTALNAVGASPRNLIAIFQALRAAGALQADIEVQ